MPLVPAAEHVHYSCSPIRMRRLLSFVLLAAFVLPMAAPLLALGQDPEAGLPACCRRHGQHHCAMLIEMQKRADQAYVGAICPHFPQHALAPTTATHLLVLQAPPSVAAFSAALSPIVRAETHRRLARERSRHKRGPPTNLL
jgi:hypothetical protein